MDLQHGVVHESAAQQRAAVAEEAGVRHLLHRVPDGQHQRGVDERHDDVVVVRVREPLEGGAGGELGVGVDSGSRARQARGCQGSPLA